MMPKVDGFELCKRIKEHSRTGHIPVIMLTAKGDLDSKLYGLRRGADDYLPKPVHAAELQLRAKNLIEIRRILHDKSSIIHILQDFNREFVAAEDAFIQQFIDLVLTHIDDPDLKIPFLLQKLRCSRSLLNRKVKDASGKSPARFIKSVRLAKARELIQEADASVSLKQIAYSVGFLDYSHFSASFKEEFGFNPVETPK